MNAVSPDQDEATVHVLMRESRVLMRDVVAKYHEGAASRNWFYRERAGSAKMGVWTELTDGGATI